MFFLLSFNCLLPSSWTRADFTHPLKCHFFFCCFTSFTALMVILMRNLCLMLLSLVVMKQPAPSWHSTSLLCGCKNLSGTLVVLVDLDSNLYACTRVVHRGRKSQMNCALGQELCCNFPKWPSSTGGECVYCSLMLVFWVFFYWLRFDYGGWGIFSSLRD